MAQKRQQGAACGQQGEAGPASAGYPAPVAGCTIPQMTSEGDARPRRVDVPAPTIADFLATTSLFTGCDRQTIIKIAPHVFPVEVPAGTVVVRAGTPSPGIGVVYSGRATVRDGDDTIEEVPPGGAFGE